MSKVHVVTVGDVPLKLVDANPNRTKLHIVTNTANGVLIGFDEGMTRDQECFLIPLNVCFNIEHYKGAVYAIDFAAGTSCTVYYFDE